MDKPDYAYWKRKQLWTLVQASYLLNDQTPRKDEEFVTAYNSGALPQPIHEIYDHLKDATDLDEIAHKEARVNFIGNRRVKPGDLVDWAWKRGHAIPVELHDLLSATQNTSITSGDHVSDKLRKLNLAAQKWWGNADKNDRTTYPDTKRIVDWLVQQAGYSETLAEKGASIIRPEWAGTGRPPEK